MTRHTITIDGLRRTYYVVKEPRRNKARLTVFGFHGSIQPVSGFVSAIGADDFPADVRVVCLEGRVSVALTDGNRRGWASSDAMAEALGLDQENDQAFFNAVRAKFSRTENDWLVGYSNGFDMAAKLGALCDMNVFGAAFCPVNLVHCPRRVEHHGGWQDVHAPFHGGASHTLDYQHLSVLDTWAEIHGIIASGVMRDLMIVGYCAYDTKRLTMHAANHFTIWNHCRDALRAAVQEG